MAATEKDPVCGMDVDPADAEGKSDFNGRTYYFCSISCKQQFDENPQQYTADRGQGATGRA